MEKISEGLGSPATSYGGSTSHAGGSVDPAAIGLPPTWVIDLTKATRSDVAVDETVES